ncbi:hypothetical protein E3O06_00740 [Cryobacterium glaciale]|uniref:Acyl-CoA thioesterase II n=1 Tax=Cryobacterium glaciale TaxID=1259145 RepID=A0A4R8V5Z1_9MICO|nr:acyl-CoA thioesterase domain-containing protein [Cryobacterium glaciale]TFB77315.1 hypothetical protein E3O06_00740 [Cryobacterium glaciale]
MSLIPSEVPFSARVTASEMRSMCCRSDHEGVSSVCALFNTAVCRKSVSVIDSFNRTFGIIARELSAVNELRNIAGSVPRERRLQDWLSTTNAPHGRVAYAPPGAGGSIFGGALLAQSLQVASLGVDDKQRPHSLQMSFLRAGDITQPVLYGRVVLNETKRFSTIRVAANQNGRLIATSTASFHSPESSPEHAAEAATRWAKPGSGTDAVGGALPPIGSFMRNSFELHAAEPTDSQRLGQGAPVGIWMRASTLVDQPAIRHASALAWASDFAMTHVADLEHQHLAGPRFATSLNHSLWFHRPFAMTEWLLHEVESPVYRDALALSVGRFFDERGRMVASVAQESLLRRSAPNPFDR